MLFDRRFARVIFELIFLGEYPTFFSEGIDGFVDRVNKILVITIVGIESGDAAVERQITASSQNGCCFGTRCRADGKFRQGQTLRILLDPGIHALMPVDVAQQILRVPY